MPLRYTAALLVVAIVVVSSVLFAKQILGKSVIKEPTTMPSVASTTQPAGPLDFVVKTIDGDDVKLSDYRGKVVMIVNVASKCGFTPQYEGLEKLYQKYADQGFVILGFPADNFGHQEPGTNAEIKSFCTGKYEVTFPMMAKVSVKGADQSPLYKFLTEPATAGDFAGDISWNFNKFLIDRRGNVYARFASNTKPQDAELTTALEKGLGAK